VEKIQPLSLHHLDKSLRLGRHSHPERFYMCALRLVKLVLCHLPSTKEQRLAQLVDHMNVITPLMQQCYMTHLNPSRLVPVWTRLVDEFPVDHQPLALHRTFQALIAVINQGLPDGVARAGNQQHMTEDSKPLPSLWLPDEAPSGTTASTGLVDPLAAPTTSSHFPLHRSIQLLFVVERYDAERTLPFLTRLLRAVFDLAKQHLVPESGEQQIIITTSLQQQQQR
jgi:hypothetical protein